MAALVPPTPPTEPPPINCMGQCNPTVALRCSSLLALSCSEAELVSQSLDCGVSCSGCCTVYPPSAPPAPPEPLLPSSPSPPPAPGYPADACPWLANATSGEVDTLVCYDGSRCNWNAHGDKCCDCRGGRALCPSNAPQMCEKLDGIRMHHVCSPDCSPFYGGPRQ
eukprot:6615688-Prymnesium_polylepis.2